MKSSAVGLRIGSSKAEAAQQERNAARLTRLNEQGVRVIVLDESAGEVGPEQLHGSKRSCEGCKGSSGEPGDRGRARRPERRSSPTGAVRPTELVRVLCNRHPGSGGPMRHEIGCASASAYFYDSPEEDVKRPPADRRRTDRGRSGPELSDTSTCSLKASAIFMVRAHPARPGRAGRARSADQQSAGERTPDPGDRRTRAGSQGRDAAAAQRAGPVRRACAPPARRQPGRSQPGNNDHAPGRPVHPDPRGMHRRMRDRSVPRIHLHLLEPRSRRSSSSTTKAPQTIRSPCFRTPKAKRLQTNHSQANRYPNHNRASSAHITPARRPSRSAPAACRYSLPVTVQAGSVRQPCGTVPAKHQTAAVKPPPPPPCPRSRPLPRPPGLHPRPRRRPCPFRRRRHRRRRWPPPPAPARPPARALPFFTPPGLATPALAFVPPPVPTPARPTPPTGTSAVTSPVEIAEHEDEEEEATESVSNQALAYSTPEHEPVPSYLLGLVLLAALAGASIGRRSRRGRREARIAPATITSMRAQRRMAPDERRPR